ncbi:hypothetical protein Sme01_13430 [Sphaerisporangium melleum]|uniref:Uncharacterized protein n=1 Tax=Sphaerisporangium melleum TaxID=321316 RepID=A0A917QTR4_9ACTN|nr:hypothetical protein GCM10007964_09030 [Sphaerisporangium melleum]GII68867.1 hypothetical protein Sme01_13430 [Sphaerisporangium melleum]
MTPSCHDLRGRTVEVGRHVCTACGVSARIASGKALGLGRIVYVSSSEQLVTWLGELGVPAPPVRPLPIREVVPGAVVDGPVPGLADEVRELHRRFHRGE